MTQRTDIVAAARGWLGTPFHHQARIKGVGVDCVGLLIGLAREFGMLEPTWDVQGYDRDPDGSTLMANCNAVMTPIDRSAMQPGDVVCVRFDNHPQHLGVLGDYRHGGLSIIHASGNAGSVIETRLMFSSAMLFVAAFSLPGATD
jgi:cell wall-associated NlpC family hydrolase